MILQRKSGYETWRSSWKKCWEIKGRTTSRKAKAFSIIHIKDVRRIYFDNPTASIKLSSKLIPAFGDLHSLCSECFLWNGLFSSSWKLPKILAVSKLCLLFVAEEKYNFSSKKMVVKHINDHWSSNVWGKSMKCIPSQNARFWIGSSAWYTWRRLENPWDNC